MRTGAVISGGLHAGALALLIFGANLFPKREPSQLILAEVEMITGAEFDAALSSAPAVPDEAPSEMPTPTQDEAAEVASETPDEAVSDRDAQLLTSRAEVPEGAAERPQIIPPPRVRVVPSEAPRMTIADIPIPDSMPIPQAEVPESRPSTEPVSALASQSTTIKSPTPVAPREVEPDPEQVAEVVPEKQETQPDGAEQAAQPDAPIDKAPREARLPVARPAELARAAQATGAVETAAAETPEREEPQKPEPETAPAPKAETPDKSTPPKAAEPAPPSQSAARFANIITRGEKEALSLGIKKYFTYNGNRADRTLRVTVSIALDASGRIVEGPELIDASGGDEGTRKALFDAGRRALKRAEIQGEFAKLPADKYEAWELIHVTFTPEEIGFGT